MTNNITSTLDDYQKAWDRIVDGFLEGGPAVPRELGEWFDAYRGRGLGAVDLHAFPEPWIGALDPTACHGVMLGLNPGKAHLDFQARDGLFANEIRRWGSYSAWAATWPYLREPWDTIKGPNRFARSRLRFLRQWTGSTLTPAAMVTVEMYPWHSTSVTAVMRPDPATIHRWVMEPIRALGAPVFAFGAPWLRLLPLLGLEEVDRLGEGGRSYGGAVPSRTVVVYDLDGVQVIAEKHSGGAGPPNTSEVEVIRDALG